MSDYKLKDLQLHKEELAKGACRYYLSAVYEYEDNHAVHEVSIPRIILPLCNPIIKQTPSAYRGLGYENIIDIGFGDLRMEWDDDLGYIYYDKIIKEKIHNMTLDEIEKKLGFKVRIVSGEAK